MVTVAIRASVADTVAMSSRSARSTREGRSGVGGQQDQPRAATNQQTESDGAD